MATMIYSAIQSLDGYVADKSGGFEWAMPDETVHSFVNDLERSVGTYLFGRRMYEVMAVWETLGLAGDEPEYIAEYGNQWRAADKVVYSTTLETVSTERTRIEREFDPESIRRMKREGAANISIGGPNLAAHAFAAGLIDEVQLFIAPVVVGGGTRSLPDHVQLDLTLVTERRFDNGMVYLNYETAGDREQTHET